VKQTRLPIWEGSTPTEAKKSATLGVMFAGEEGVIDVPETEPAVEPARVESTRTRRGAEPESSSSSVLLFLFPRTEWIEGALGDGTGVEEEVKIEDRGKTLFLPGQWHRVICFWYSKVLIPFKSVPQVAQGKVEGIFFLDLWFGLLGWFLG
jgi:hypothetical protein